MLRRVSTLLIALNFALVGLAARPCLAGCAKQMARTCCTGELGIRGPSCCPPAQAEIKASTPALHGGERAPLLAAPSTPAPCGLSIVAAHPRPSFSGSAFFPPGPLVQQHTSLLL